MAWTPPLSLERAIEITTAIAERALHAKGLLDPDKPMTSLEGITLGQMVEAAALVERANAQPAQEGRSKT